MRTKEKKSAAVLVFSVLIAGFSGAWGDTPVSFTEVTHSAGVGAGGISRGVAWGDYDGDGDPDLYVTNSGTSLSSANSLYRNEGDGTFVEIGESAGVDDAESDWGAVWGDYDDDGDLDLYVARQDGANRLYRNEGNGTFTDVGAEAGVNDDGFGRSPAWGDYDRDGDLDLFLGNAGSPDRLYRNEGDGTFTDVGARAGVAASGNAGGVAWGDYDDDGDLDLYVAHILGVNHLYRNEGDGTFIEVGAVAGVDDGENSRGVAWGDYDGDGDLDLYVANYNAPNRLYRNEGDGTFTEVGAIVGVDHQARGEGVAWVDVDGDGRLDLYLANEGSANALYWNRSNVRFEDVAISAFVDGDGLSHGMAWSDYDGDGDPDLYVASAGTNQLYRNEGANHHWLTIRLVGVQSNSAGIGARLTVEAGGLPLQRRDVDGGSGLNSQPSAEVEFGLGDTSIVDLLTVHWPSGIVQEFADIRADQVLIIVEGEEHPRSPPLPDLQIRERIAFMANRDGNYEIYAMKADGDEPIRLTDNAWRDISPDWSPDGTRIVLGSDQNVNEQIYVMNADGTGRIRLTEGELNDQFPNWSPDGRRVVFTSYRDGNSEIYVMEADGTDLTRLTHTEMSDERDPVWSPDGSRIAFAIYENDYSEIYVMEADGTNLTRLTYTGQSNLSPVWSPDGSRIAFHSLRDGNSEIYVMKADGMDQVRLTDDGAGGFSPSWSPDGSRIAFAGGPAGAPEIYAMKADGTDLTRLTDEDGINIAPSWAPFRHVGATSVGSSVSRRMLITNAGEVELVVRRINSSDGQFAVSPANLAIAPAGSQEVMVTFTPVSEGTQYATLTIVSNDPDDGEVRLIINGTGMAATVAGGGTEDNSDPTQPEDDADSTPEAPEDNGDGDEKPDEPGDVAGSGQDPTQPEEDPAVVIDFDLADGDQEQRRAGDAVFEKVYEIQLQVKDAPEINGWNVDIEYNSTQLRYMSNSFQASGFIPGFVGLANEVEGMVSVGGTVLGSDGKNSGDGTLATLSFEVLEDFADSTDLVVTMVNFRRLDGLEDRRTLHSPATITSESLASAGGLPGDFNGDGQVNFDDFFLFADAFGGTDPLYDLDGSGRVDFDDFFLFADNFGREERAKLMALAREHLGLPLPSRLERNYPNPFNPSTTIPFHLSEMAAVRLEIYDALGQKVRTLVEGAQSAGHHQVVWDGRDESGSLAAAGVYIYRLQAGTFSQTRKLLFVK